MQQVSHRQKQTDKTEKIFIDIIYIKIKHQNTQKNFVFINWQNNIHSIRTKLMLPAWWSWWTDCYRNKIHYLHDEAGGQTAIVTTKLTLLHDEAGGQTAIVTTKLTLLHDEAGGQTAIVTTKLTLLHDEVGGQIAMVTTKLTLLHDEVGGQIATVTKYTTCMMKLVDRLLW